jgi:hypothetical protein
LKRLSKSLQTQKKQVNAANKPKVVNETELRETAKSVFQIFFGVEKALRV